MPLKPSVSVTKLLKSSASFVLQDTTPTYAAPDTNLTGYGAPGAQAWNSFTNLIVQEQYTGEDVVTVPINNSDIVNDGTNPFTIPVAFLLRDGVHTLNVLYGYVADPAKESWTASNGMLQLTIIDPAGTPETIADALGNITHIADPNDATVLYKIKSVNLQSGLIEFYTPYPDGTITSLVKYYTASVKLLVINSGEGQLLKDIANVAATGCGCDYNASKDFIDRILLKLAAQSSFACKNYAKAHNAAVLLNARGGTKPCSTC